MEIAKLLGALLAIYLFCIGTEMVLFHPECLDFGRPENPVSVFLYDWMTVPLGFLMWAILSTALGRYSGYKEKAKKYDSLMLERPQDE